RVARPPDPGPAQGGWAQRGLVGRPRPVRPVGSGGRVDRRRRHRPVTGRRSGRSIGRARRARRGRDPRAREARGALPGTAGPPMNPTFTIAALTIKESVRRRLLLAFVAITAVIVGLSAWGFDRLAHSHSITSGENHVAIPEALILFMFMFSFV